MKNISLSIIVALFGLLFLNSCIDDDYATPKQVEPQFEMPANAKLISIDELKGIYTKAVPSTGKYLSADQFVTVEEDVYISGYVISDDKEGNFYKTLMIQGNLEGSSQGISISIGESALFTSYALGQKIFVKCKGLILGKYGNEVQLGGTYYFYKYRDQEKFKEYRLSPIPSPSIDFHIFKDENPVAIKPVVRKIGDVGTNVTDNFNKVVLQLTNDKFKFTYMTFKNVEFVGSSQTWGKIGGEHRQEFPFNTDATVIDENGMKLPLFTSNYSKFAHLMTPSGKFNMTGVLSVHSGNAQFVINSLDDIDLIK